MTLAVFKKNLKVFVIFFFLVVYGFILYEVGRRGVIGSVRQEIEKRVSQKKVADNTVRPLPENDVQSGSVVAAYVKLCSNSIVGYEVAYPKDWFTTYNSDDQQCAFFAPFSFVIPTQFDNNFAPITIEPVKPQDWTSTIKLFENPNDFQNVISIQNIDINGKAIEKISASSTGRGLIPKGFDKLTFLVFDAKTPLIFTYQQLEEKENIQQSEKVLEEMTKSLQYF